VEVTQPDVTRVFCHREVPSRLPDPRAVLLDQMDPPKDGRVDDLTSTSARVEPSFTEHSPQAHLITAVDRVHEFGFFEIPPVPSFR